MVILNIVVSRVINILREIELLAPKNGKHEFIVEKSEHAYEAVRKLFDLIESEYSDEDAEDLMKRFINAARTRDFKKFKRGIDRIKKEKMEDKNTK